MRTSLNELSLIVCHPPAVILFEVYKQSFIRWLQPLTNWLDARRTWSWVLPVVVLFILSFPPLFGHELVLIITGLVFGLGIAIGIACVGTILGEAGCFFAFKYAFTGYVDRKRARLIKWEALARVLSRSSFKNVMLIRYSIVPPREGLVFAFKKSEAETGLVIRSC